ncbi:MAG: class I SAM-dependent methyltransferase [Myxococcales bacterium]|nr:class I SAM-dependent methyltransferase [Myxococcales bacterium]
MDANVSEITRRKWDKAAANFDLMAGNGPEKRWAPFKQEFFSAMDGKVLFLAVGTGLDIPFFPENRDIVGIDISPKMLEKARPRAEAYRGNFEMRVCDVHDLDYPDGHFDKVFTSCTFCSVPDPVRGLESLRRVLRPSGELHMFEHTGSRYFPFSLMMNLMTPLAKKFGPEMNRPTVDNVKRAGFEVDVVRHVYLDVVKTIHAHSPAAG